MIDPRAAATLTRMPACAQDQAARLRAVGSASHEPPLTPSLSRRTGEGARRAGEGGFIAREQVHGEHDVHLEPLTRDRQRRLTSAATALVYLGLGMLTALASPPPVPISPAVQHAVDAAVRSTLDRYRDVALKPDELAVSLVDLTNPAAPGRGAYRGDVAIYPASVVKLFYLAAANRWLEDGRLQDTPELERALRDMIVLSYNEATHYVVDLLTGTTSGPELPEDELRTWFDRRNVVNRYFASLGYTGINANKKPWCEGPYGRETQAIRAFDPKRNMLTTDATARLVWEIATGQMVSVRRSADMLELMKRDLSAAGPDPDDQARFSGPALPPGARLWSKAGWTSETRHDAIYVELPVPDGRRFVLVVFTLNHANDRGVIQHVVREIVAHLPHLR